MINREKPTRVGRSVHVPVFRGSEARKARRRAKDHPNKILEIPYENERDESGTKTSNTTRNYAGER